VRKYGGNKKIEILTGLRDFSLSDYEKVVLGMLSACIHAYIDVCLTSA
jgi:hypothetical protein